MQEDASSMVSTYCDVILSSYLRQAQAYQCVPFIDVLVSQRAHFIENACHRQSARGHWRWEHFAASAEIEAFCAKAWLRSCRLHSS